METKNHNKEICANCGKQITGKDWSRKFCSNECRIQNQRKVFQSRYDRVSPEVCAGTRGAIGEIAVCLDLLRQNYTVFRAVSPSSPFDLIAYKNGKLFKIEVKTGYFDKTGKPKCGKPAKTDFDILAIVVNTIHIVYQPELKVY